LFHTQKAAAPFGTADERDRQKLVRERRSQAINQKLFVISGIVDEAAGTMTTLIAAVLVKVWFTLLVELGSVVDSPIWVVDHAADAMTTIVAAVWSIIAGRVMMLPVRVFGHPFDERA
jgi:hypothetical protein